MSEARTTFGFHRTECACAECALNCRFIPGYVSPTDIAAIAHHLGYENLLTFALDHLLASPGATVMANGELFQIPTLVPARQANGACKFLTADHRCAIHTVSPYGCSHFDVHQSLGEEFVGSSSHCTRVASKRSLCTDMDSSAHHEARCAVSDGSQKTITGVSFQIKFKPSPRGQSSS